jgi:hypothetical protein
MYACVYVHVHQNFIFFLFMYVHVYHTTCLPMCVRVHMCKRHTQHLCASGILFVHVCVIVDKENLEEGKLVCGLPAQYSPRSLSTHPNVKELKSDKGNLLDYIASKGISL